VPVADRDRNTVCRAVEADQQAVVDGVDDSVAIDAVVRGPPGIAIQPTTGSVPPFSNFTVCSPVVRAGTRSASSVAVMMASD
jgi:hypothetical protein